MFYTAQSVIFVGPRLRCRMVSAGTALVAAPLGYLGSSRSTGTGEEAMTIKREDEREGLTGVNKMTESRELGEVGIKSWRMELREEGAKT